MGTGSFPGVKRPGRGVDHPPSSSAEVKERVLNINVCKIFERDINNEVGLQFVISVLSPLLCIGHTISNLNLSRYIPDDNEELHVKVNGLPLTFAKHFKILLEIPSHPDEFLVLRDFIVFMISTSVTRIFSSPSFY
jgi:hypothetical protein